MATRITTDEMKVRGRSLIKTIKQLIAEGNVRRITIKDKQGRVLMELPLTIGVVGVALAPVVAVVGTIAALITECTITVERLVPATPKKTTKKRVTKK